MENILVTGANGFIGSALVKKLELNGNNVSQFTSNQGDVSEYDFIDNYTNHQIDHIFHLAAKTFVPNSWKSPKEFYKVSLMGTENILEFCRTQNIPLTFISSYLYGNPATLPISENSPIKPNNPYAHSKYLAEQLCEFYSEYYDVKVTIVRPFNIYGKKQSDIFLIPHIINQILNHNEIKVQNLEPKRDYLYLEDLIEGLIKTIDAKKKFSIYNFGSGYSLSVQEIIDTIQAVANTNKNILSEQNERKNEIMDVIADISKVKSDLDWSPTTAFKDGIKKILEDISQ